MKKIPRNPILFGLYAKKPYKIMLLLAFMSVIGGAVLGQFGIILIRQLTDSLVSNAGNLAEAWHWLFILLGIFIVKNVFWRSSGFIGMKYFTQFHATAHKDLYDYISYHSKDYFNNRFAGSVANKISNAVEGSEQIWQKFLWRFTEITLDLIVFFVISWRTSPVIGLVFGTWTLTFLALNYVMSGMLQSKSQRVAEVRSIMKGKIIDSLSNISLVHEAANFSFESAYVGKSINNQRKADYSEWYASEWILVVNGILVFIFMAGMFTSSLYLFQKGVVTVGVMVMIIAIVQDVSHQLFFIGQEMKEVARNYGKAKEGLDEVLQPYDIVDKAEAKSVQIKKGSISLKDVTFGYGQSEVFSDFTLDILHGEKVGLVGRSGAGKSTFISLLLRHYEPQKGAILLDGYDTADITLESLRKSVAYVPQDTSLFHRSVEDNIAFTNPNASKAMIKKAAERALADTFIDALPKKYETLVGERGVKLSGGQRQRIAIARAFLKDAPILILDEATSSLDSESEAAVQKSLDTLMKDRTVIAIAHRLSTLRKMDRIIVMEDGKIVEDGSPHQLLEKKNGVFKSLWDHQVSGFIVEE